MKHILSLICVLLFVLSIPSALANEETAIWDFEDLKNPGFYKSGSCRYSVEPFPDDSGSCALHVSERTGDGSGALDIRPASLDLRLGDRVYICVLFRQDSVPQCDFSLYMTSDKSVPLLSVTADQGKWTTLEGEFTLSDNSNLHFSPSELLSGQDFWLDQLEVRLLAHAAKEESRYERWPKEIPSLKELFREHFLFGGAAAGLDLKDPSRMDFYVSQFAILTPGNELKPDSVFDRTASQRAVQETGDETQVRVRLNAAKPFLDFCSDHRIPVHGHTLLWHNQTPADFFRLGYVSSGEMADREIMLGRMENYIKAVMELTEREYPGLIVSWDVVNEAIDDSTGQLRENVSWYRSVGPDYVEKAFEFARKYAREDILLCYNDYNSANFPKSRGILELLTALATQGNIDCYGFQAHYETNNPTVSMVESMFRKVIDLGLKIRVSEMDVKVTAVTPLGFEQQAKKYRDLMEMFIRYDSSLVAVQTWGGTDDTSWRSADRPLLFAAYGEPKPAFWAVTELFQTAE